MKEVLWVPLGVLPYTIASRKPESRVPAPSAASHRTFLNGSHPAFLADESLPPPSALHTSILSNCELQLSRNLAIARHYHARPDSAQGVYRNEAGIGAACLYQLLDQA